MEIKTLQRMGEEETSLAKTSIKTAFKTEQAAATAKVKDAEKEQVLLKKDQASHAPALY
jgi:hypothetical protein